MARGVAAEVEPMKALVLEDDERLAQFLGRVLSEEGLETDLCTNGTDAIAQAGRNAYQLVVLDWMVPETDGLEVCREIRRMGGVMPILMLTARGATHERVLGLEAGADDYMPKPFEVDEFVARVRALQRRFAGFVTLRRGDLEIDTMARQARVAGATLELTNREYAVLLNLVQNADRTVRRSELLARVWGMRFDPGSNLVEVHISRLRHKLSGCSVTIETIRGLGYRLLAPTSA
ncbi:MAG TPA: response regulator transcription factor [Polyangiaceae bacterium]|nr:response regulator transcription factor [Polyangiaceae bacterium]